jgi:hypothetical protein
MYLILYIFSAIILSGCEGRKKLAGDASGDSLNIDSLDDDYFEIPESWECIQNEDCYDEDGCTLDLCNMSTHICEHEPRTGYGFIADDIQLTHDPHYSELGAMLWTGSTLGLAWTDGRDRGCIDVPGPIYCGMEVYFKIVDVMGNDISTDTRLSHADTMSKPVNGIWNGSAFAIGWINYRSIYGEYSASFSTLGPSGVPFGVEIMPAGELGGRWLSIGWSGSEYGIAWTQGEVFDDPSIESALRFSRYTPGGVELGDAVLIDDSTRFGIVSLLWTGSSYGFFYYKDGNHWFNRIDNVGELVGEPIETPSDDVHGFNMAWTGSLYAVIWSTRYPEGSISDRYSLFYTTVSQEGERYREPILLTDPDAHSTAQDIAWTGSELGITWTKATSIETKAYAMRIDADGNRVEEDVVIKEPSLIEWTGSEYIVGWSEDRDGTWQLYMNKLGFCE